MRDQWLLGVTVNHHAKSKDFLPDCTEDVWTNFIFQVKVDDRAALHLHEYIKEYSRNGWNKYPQKLFVP